MFTLKNPELIQFRVFLWESKSGCQAQIPRKHELSVRLIQVLPWHGGIARRKSVFFLSEVVKRGRGVIGASVFSGLVRLKRQNAIFSTFRGCGALSGEW